MRKILTALLASIAVGLGAASLGAAPIGDTARQQVTPLVQLTQGYYYGGGYYGAYRPACPERYYFACWFDPYGRQQCGCRPGLAYYLFRYN
jgi:hypothetical protein